jgi:hypothetical protein
MTRALLLTLPGEKGGTLCGECPFADEIHDPFYPTEPWDYICTNPAWKTAQDGFAKRDGDMRLPACTAVELRRFRLLSPTIEPVRSRWVGGAVNGELPKSVWLAHTATGRLVASFDEKTAADAVRANDGAYDCYVPCGRADAANQKLSQIAALISEWRKLPPGPPSGVPKPAGDLIEAIETIAGAVVLVNSERKTGRG